MATKHDDANVNKGRRHALRSLAMMGATAAAPALLLADTVPAEACTGTTSKSAMQYQGKPKGKDQCSNCQLFCPGSSAKAMGTCKLVKGSISPKGWCVAWTPA